METRNKTPGADVGTRTNPGAVPHNDPDRVMSDMKQQGEVIRDQARAVGDQLKSGAAQAGQQAKEKAGQAAEQAQRKAAEYARQAQSQGKVMLDQQKSVAAERVHTVGDAVRRAAEKFREEKDDNIAGYVEAAADEVQRLGDYLQRRDLNSLWRDAQSFGRKRPEWLLGGMFMAGLALTRFLKASAERQESDRLESYRGYESDRGYQMGDRYRSSTSSYSSQSGFADETSSSTQPFSGATGLGVSAGTTGSLSTANPLGTTNPAAAPTPATYTTPLATPTVTTPGTRPTPGAGQPSTQPEVH